MTSNHVVVICGKFAGLTAVFGIEAPAGARAQTPGDDS